MPIAMVVVVMTFPIAAAVIPVPAVIVLEATAIAFPVPGEVLAAFVSGTDPPGSRIRRARPISFVPAVMVAHWIPIAVHPGKTRPGGGRPNRYYTRRWRRTNANSYGNLAEHSARGQ
jgi:hypothetical protein